MAFPKDFFDLQFSFAERVRALSGMPLERALFEYTNFYVRFGLGRAFDAEHATWRSYLAGLHDVGDARDWTYRFYLRDAEATTAPAVVATFGCFSYAFQAPKLVRLHFLSTDVDGQSPLAAARSERRRAELTALFKHLKASAAEDVSVAGISWLYNLAAYRRLFPLAYTSSARVVRGRFRAMPLWGQFLNHRRQLKDSMARPFSSALAKASSLTELDACFPFQALAVEASAREFYRCYGV